MLLAVLVSQATLGRTVECAALAGRRLGDARIESAALVAKGAPLALWAGAPPSAAPRDFCRVRAVATPVAGSRIGIEVWLPSASQWNGKYLQAGNGGFAGGVPLGALFDALQRGYSAAATDGGHVSADGLDASFGMGHPERVVDFGWRAVQRTTVAAKRLIRATLGRAPTRSYFVGCSDGGRDAMMVAQRSPAAFAGIVSGAPAMYWTELMVAGALLQRELAPQAASAAACNAGSLAACGAGAFVRDPLQCHFDPAVLRCAGEENATCLTATQASAARMVYAGVADPSTGEHLPGLEPGAEAQPGNWDFWLLAAPTNPLGDSHGTRSLPESFFRYLVRADPAFTLADLTDADLLQAHQRWGATLDAVDTDLGAFRRHGGRLIQYHGWSDSAIPPRFSIAYHSAVERRLGDTSAFYRLFMIPGMNHCGGGAGPWRVDWIDVLEQWVERGVAPRQLLATEPRTGQTQALRPFGGA